MIADFSVPIRSGVTPAGQTGSAYLTTARRRRLDEQLKALAVHRADAARALRRES